MENNFYKAGNDLLDKLTDILIKNDKDEFMKMYKNRFNLGSYFRGHDERINEWNDKTRIGLIQFGFIQGVII